MERYQLQGRIQDFKLGGGGAHLNCAERREARKILGYFVWKITILRQKIIFLPIAEGGAKFVWVFRVKNHDFTPNFFFSNFRGGARRVRPPPLDPPLNLNYIYVAPSVCVYHILSICFVGILCVCICFYADCFLLFYIWSTFLFRLMCSTY